MLLLHGLGADGSSWAYQMPALGSAGFRPIAVDAPGFGGSPYDGGGWSIRGTAARTAALLEELGAGPAHIVGLSMGGVIAQQFALDFPQLTQKLVLVSTFAVLRPEEFNGWWYFIRRAGAILLLGKHAQAQIVARRVFPHAEDQGLRDLFIAAVAQAHPRAYRKAMLSLGLFDSRERLGKITAPTLVVSGAEDSTVTPARQKVLADGIPGACQVVIEQAGHAVSVDQAERFNREILVFLKS